MKAVIFVFSSVSVPNDPAQPLRKYDPTRDLVFEEAPVVPADPTGAPVRLEPGIYAVLTPNDMTRPPIRNTGDRVDPGATHVVVEYAGKDKWPDPPSTEVMALHDIAISPPAFAALAAEVRRRMADVHQQIDTERLNLFLLARGERLGQGAASAQRSEHA